MRGLNTVEALTLYEFSDRQKIKGYNSKDNLIDQILTAPTTEDWPIKMGHIINQNKITVQTMGSLICLILK